MLLTQIIVQVAARATTALGDLLVINVLQESTRQRRLTQHYLTVVTVAQATTVQEEVLV